jgi:hypothetical protein
MLKAVYKPQYTLPVGVGVKVPAGSLLNSQATQLTIGAQST